MPQSQGVLDREWSLPKTIEHARFMDNNKYNVSKNGNKIGVANGIGSRAIGFLFTV
jgi:hypothetical protein